LADLAWMNRCLGVTGFVAHQLGRLVGESVDRLRVLDVAAGGGDILVGVDLWCRSRSVDFRGVAVDRGTEASQVARRRVVEPDGSVRIEVVRGDALRLPFTDRAFDVAISSTFLHHLEPEQAIQTLREMARVSEVGFVVSDLRRGFLGYLGSLGLAYTIWARHPYTRHDGPVSMRAAFTLQEARELAVEAGLEVVVEPQPLFRWTMRWKREHEAS
jgi:SAM-dependent methyltransferase